MSKSLFVKIIDGEIPCHKIYEDDKFFAFLDINPINAGHTLLIPKIQIDYIFDLEDKLYTELFLKAKELSKIIKKATGCKRVGLAVEGFMVPHVHIHLVPLNKGNELNPERAKSVKEEELKQMAEKIKSNL
jgi:histidine triad (HIT) family protein